MSDKMECPGCNSYTSSVLSAVSQDEPCPYCGLSPDAIVEINAVRGARADEVLKARLKAALLAESRAAAGEQVMRELATDMVEIGLTAQRWLDAHPSG